MPATGSGASGRQEEAKANGDSAVGQQIEMIQPRKSTKGGQGGATYATDKFQMEDKASKKDKASLHQQEQNSDSRQRINFYANDNATFGKSHSLYQEEDKK